MNIEFIEFIVAEQKKVAAEIEQQKVENVPVQDEKSVFKDNSPEGLLEKQKLRAILQFSKLDLIPINQFFDAISTLQKFNTTPFAQTNRKGDKYYWIKQYGKFGMTEYKLPYFEGLDELMTAYLFGVYRFKIDFKALLEEAVK
jgi:hypothetical protein